MFLDRQPDHGRDALRVGEDLGVPKPDHAPTASREIRGPARIDSALVVLPAVGFDNQAMLDADEAGDERADRVLAAKLVAAQPPVA